MTGQPTTITVKADGTAVENVYYEVDTSQNSFAYTVNYYISGTTTQVPGIDQTAAGNATPSGTGYVGEVIAIAQPTLTNGYRVEGGQPTSLTVNGDGTATATVYYSVNAASTYGYEINYYLNGTTTPVPGITPNPTTGTGVLNQNVTVPHPTLTNGYKVVASQPTSITITATAANNTATVYYEIDPTQLFDYTVHYVTEAGTQLKAPVTGQLPVESVLPLTEDAIEGYEPVVGNPTQLVISSGTNEAYIVYKAVSGSARTTGFVIVTFYDGADTTTAKQLGTVWMQGDVGTSYNVTDHEIEGYTYTGLASPSAPLFGNFENTSQYVNLHYTLIPRPTTPIIDALITTETTVVTGTAQPGMEVELSVGGVSIGKATADATTGEFVITIAAQAEGAVITATAKNLVTGLISDPDYIAVVQINAPTITAADIVLNEGDVFDDKAGVTAADSDGSDLTASVTVTGTVDTSVPGTYLLTYEVTDSKGVTGKVVRIVTVNEVNSPPTITAPATVPLEVGDAFDPQTLITDGTITASDPDAGDTVTLTVESSTVDTTKPGTYVVLYKAVDNTGTAVYKTVEITVTTPIVDKDTYQPIPAPEVIEVGDTPDYSDNIKNWASLPSGTTMTDLTAVGAVDTTTPGTYEATVRVTYPDTTFDDVTIPVIVKAKISLADQFAPIIAPEEIAPGGTPDLTDNIINVADMPPGTTVTQTVTQDGAGNYTGSVTLTFTDGSTKTINVPITVTTPPPAVGTGQLIVRAIESGSGTVITQIELTGKTDSAYAVATPTISGYVYEGLGVGSAPLTGTLNDGTQTIIMNFAKTAKPAAPTMNGPFTDKTTAVTGTGTPGDVITIKDGVGNTLGSATVGSDGTFSVPITPQTPGTVVTAMATGASGNSEISMAAILPASVTPGTPPTMSEVSPIRVGIGGIFDPKASAPTATDAEDGDLSPKVTVEQNNVDVRTPGKYSVIYKVTDSDGHTAYRIATVQVIGGGTGGYIPPATPRPTPTPTPTPRPSTSPTPGTSPSPGTSPTPGAGTVSPSPSATTPVSPSATPEVTPEPTEPDDGAGGWALLNLLLTIGTGIIMVYLLASYKKEDDDRSDGSGRQERRKTERRGTMRIISIIPVAAAVIVFVLTENMSAPMVFTDRYTIWMGLIAVAQVVVLLLSRKKRDGSEKAA